MVNQKGADSAGRTRTYNENSLLAILKEHQARVIYVDLWGLETLLRLSLLLVDQTEFDSVKSSANRQMSDVRV